MTGVGAWGRLIGDDIQRVLSNTTFTLGTENRFKYFGTVFYNNMNATDFYRSVPEWNGLSKGSRTLNRTVMC